MLRGPRRATSTVPAVEVQMTKLMRRSGGTAAVSRSLLGFSLTVGLTLGVGLGLVPGCDSRDPSELSDSEGAGALGVSLAGLGSRTTTGFQIDVVTAGGVPAASRYVATAPTADAFFVLAAGAY